MKQPLDLFPARIAIGMFYDQGKRVDVTMTPEFFRALRDVLQRIGGSGSDVSVDEALVETFTPLAISGNSDSGVTMDMVISAPVAAYIDQKVQEMVLMMMPRRNEMSEMTMGH